MNTADPDKAPRALTEQELFWAGEFGDAYSERNQGARWVAANLEFFARALRRAGPIASCLELGANIGLNLRALALMHPGIELHAVEINAAAVAGLANWLPSDRIHHSSLLDYQPERRFDLVLSKGVLIHQNPDTLNSVYDRIHDATLRYVLLAEYYSPTPVGVPYRGHSERLYKRDFAGEMLDRHSDMRLVDYGFIYRRDERCPQDDITWFLLEKATDERRS